MRRMTTLLWALTAATLFLVSAPAASGSGREREPAAAIQPIDSDRNLVLLSATGWARVDSDRGRDRLALGGDETLTAILETRRGWVTAGFRPDDRGSALIVLESAAGDTASRLPPLRRSGALQLVPVLLDRDGELAGAAWLEGDSQRELFVRFAEWTGAGWGPVETVSRPRRGSQTGLVGTTLRNGEVILAWSRYDGSDDEIYWSRRDGGAWSRPERVGPNNRAPDISPAIARSGRGALLVWARMDGGHYHVVSRKFRGGEWKRERRVGSAGSVLPTLVRSSEGLLAVFRTAAPRGWTVAELESRSGAVRRARVDSREPRRPVVASLEPAGPVLRWPDAVSDTRTRWDLLVP